jgi:UDP-glucose 4-epimerase
MKVLVTGGMGFIGSHLVDELVKRSHQVTVIDNGQNSTGHENPRARYIMADLRDSRAASEKIRAADVVFHLAGNFSVVRSTEDPRFDFEANLQTTFNVLEAMRRNDIRKIVFPSTSGVYGIQKSFPIRETSGFDNLRPINNYAASKLASEVYIHSFSNIYGISGVVLRLANVVGPRSNHGIVPDIIGKIRKTPERIEVLGNGRQRKSYIHVADCVNAMIMASKEEKNFDVINVGYEEWATVKSIVDLICLEMNAAPKVSYTGGEGGWPGDVPEFLLDVSKMKSLGWRPQMKLKDAVIDTVRWHEHQ